MGHNNKRDVQKLSKSVQGMKLHNSSFCESFCDICAANKLNRKPPSSKTALRRSLKLELVCLVTAADVAFYLTNRCLSCSLLPNKTPFELFYGRKPDLSNLKILVARWSDFSK